MTYTVSNRGVAVGECRGKPTPYEVEIFLKRKGYNVGYVEIWYDDLKKIWMWQTSVDRY